MELTCAASDAQVAVAVENILAVVDGGSVGASVIRGDVRLLDRPPLLGNLLNRQELVGQVYKAPKGVADHYLIAASGVLQRHRSPGPSPRPRSDKILDQWLVPPGPIKIRHAPAEYAEDELLGASVGPLLLAKADCT